MHPLFQKADALGRQVIGAAIEVHRLKGPGLIESIYERCLLRELDLRQIASVNQRRLDHCQVTAISAFPAAGWLLSGIFIFFGC